MLRSLFTPARRAVALASGVALTAYVAQQTLTVRAAEPAADHIFVINGCAPFVLFCACVLFMRSGDTGPAPLFFSVARCVTRVVE